MNRRAIGRLGAAGACALGIGVFFEASARAALAVPWVFARTAGCGDAGWRLQWVRRDHDRGLSYSFDVYHPTRGWALRPGLRHAIVFGGRVLSSNARGLRGVREYAYARSPGVARIEVFGDSFTFGEGVGDDDTYAARLERLLGGGAEVMNFGVHGYGNDQMLVYLEEDGLRYRPDVVLLGFVDWDMERNLLEFRDYSKPRFELVDGRLRLCNSPVPTPSQVRTAEPQRPRFLDLLSMLAYGARRQFGWSAVAAARVTEAILDAFAGAVEAAGAKLVVVYLPAEREIDAPSGVAVSGETFITRHCQGRGLALIDLRPVFLEQEREGIRLRTRGHWNRREHLLAAEAIRSGLRAGGLLSGAPGQR